MDTKLNKNSKVENFCAKPQTKNDYLAKKKKNKKKQKNKTKQEKITIY